MIRFMDFDSIHGCTPVVVPDTILYSQISTFNFIGNGERKCAENYNK